jgi:phenylalanyl-tRNA synthetase beta chain
MPTVSFPLDYLHRLSPLTAEQLQRLAFNYGLDTTLSQEALEVEVTAERPDLLSAEGFTRALNIYNGQARTVPKTLLASDLTLQVSPTVHALRPFIAALVAENVRFSAAGLASLIQFQEKVCQTFGRQRQKMAIGIYDLDQVSGDLEYTTADKTQLSFIPLGGDRPLTVEQLLSQHPSGRLYAHTLPAGKLVPVLRDSAGQVLSMPPIVNAAGVGEVTPATGNLFIDVTGISEKTVLEMINILAHNFLDAGAEVKTVTILTPTGDHTTPDLTRKSISFSAKFLNQTLGIAIPKQDLGTYLARMDLEATGTNVILAPTYRTDLFSQIDVAGDLMVAIGVDTLKPEPTALKFHTGSADPLRTYVLQVGDLAQRMGLMEVKTFVLTDPELLSQFADSYIQTANAKSRSLSATRMTLQAGLLEILSRNISAPKPINIYETGEVVNLTATGQMIETFYWGFASLDAKASFAIAKSYVQTLLKALHIPYELTVCAGRRYIPGRAATVLIGGQVAGHFGEIHPEVLHYFSFPEPVCAGELDCWMLMAASLHQ